MGANSVLQEVKSTIKSMANWQVDDLFRFDRGKNVLLHQGRGEENLLYHFFGHMNAPEENWY